MLFVHCRFASPSYRLFSLAGIWPDGADGTDVNSVDRAKGKQLVATGDDFGNVNLYRYPCVSEKVRISLCNLIFLFCWLSSHLAHRCLLVSWQNHVNSLEPIDIIDHQARRTFRASKWPIMRPDFLSAYRTMNCLPGVTLLLTWLTSCRQFLTNKFVHLTRNSNF